MILARHSMMSASISRSVLRMRSLSSRTFLSRRASRMYALRDRFEVLMMEACRIVLPFFVNGDTIGVVTGPSGNSGKSAMFGVISEADPAAQRPWNDLYTLAQIPDFPADCFGPGFHVRIISQKDDGVNNIRGKTTKP
jgi:hypothetical protein